MDDVSNRFRAVAAGFTARVEAVPAGAWDNPSPCAGWRARDVVGHLVEWVPPFLHGGAGVELPVIPPVDEDPVLAWATLRDGLQVVLDDPVTSASTFSNPHTGTHRLDDAIGQFVLGDVLVHTWDLARATGLDESLDPDEVARMAAGVEAMGDALEKSGQYGPRVAIDDAADVQTRLLALTGRRP